MIRPRGRALFATLAFLVPSAATAGLEVCNDTGTLQAVAIGYFQGEDKVSEGWWTIQPGSCSTPIAQDLAAGAIYLHARSPDPQPEYGGTDFCTSALPFTILNSEDCGDQGHQSALFHEISVGEEEPEIRFELSQLSQIAAQDERVIDDAVFHSCQHPEDGTVQNCAFHADGIRYDVSAKTPASVMRILGEHAPGTPLTVKGLVTARDGKTATVVIGDAQTRPETASDRMLLQLQGNWESVDDPNERLTIRGGERVGTYDGQSTGTDYLSVQDTCADEPGDGPYLRAADSAGDDVYCYVIESIGASELTLIYLPRGNLLEYRKVE